MSPSVHPGEKICETCPVSAECLEWAVSNNIGHGVWGGLSERQRRPLVAARRAAAVGEAA